MTNVSAVDSKISSLRYDTVFLLLKKTFPNGVSILFSIDDSKGENFYKSCRKL